MLWIFLLGLILGFMLCEVATDLEEWRAERIARAAKDKEDTL